MLPVLITLAAPRILFVKCDVYVLRRWPGGFVDVQSSRTSLHAASENGHLLVVEKLLGCGALVHAHDKVR